MKTTRDYPITRAQAEAKIQQAVKDFGENQARGDMNYRRGITTNVITFSFVESPRTRGAYREIGYAS